MSTENTDQKSQEQEVLAEDNISANDEKRSADEYRVNLPVFDGPLDLLLHLIRKHELDIFDIPIAMITTKYLEYLNLMQVLNLDVAGEFLVMAATLAKIKSKMLLPAGESDEDEDEGEDEDPRQELVRRLLEYQRYKEAAEELRERPILQRDVFARTGSVMPVAEEDNPFIDVSVFRLIEAFDRVIRKAKKHISHEIFVDRVSVADKIQELVDLLQERKEIVFDDLFGPNPVKLDIVVTFIALLEMTRLHMVRLHQLADSETIYVRNLLDRVDVDKLLASAKLDS